MTPDEAAEYLDRIGTARPAVADLGALRVLQRAHLNTVPFENLSIHLDEPVVLDEGALFTKVVKRRRGGFCYELNGLFAALLSELGYRVDLLSARVFGDGHYGIPFDHMTLRVHLDEAWLVDVGFGRFAAEPLRFGYAGEQVDPFGSFRLEQIDGDTMVSMDGTPQIRVDPRAYELGDFAPTCWWQTTSPESHFTKYLTCSIAGSAGGRISLFGGRLVITDASGERTDQQLDTDEAIHDAYRRYFGFDLDRLPRLPG